MKFYPSDWRADPRLRMCSLAARGLWMEMLALMHEATPYGHLLISGISPTDAQLAVLAGAPSDQIPDLLGELESAGVFSRTRSGAIYSRRMTRDDKKSAQARKNGKNGGNPILCNSKGNTPPDNPQDKGGDKTQKPEARSQKPERENIPLSQKSSARSSEPVSEQPFEVPDRSGEQSRFPEFWGAYPLKANMVKAEAEFITATLRGADPEVVISAARRFAASQQGKDPTYIPQPANWLKNRRWTDEIPAAAPPDPEQARRIRALEATARRFA
ncbi:hypothetical protein [Amaricoccus solimangrovi]|uniref:DUF1376 domain-containing protein n=1 Tax=Amaricoccus solimangrovi TaxID=2589815 RepID=A0A501WTK4_9RHOB|nr:hypothetical protein [Amaricoccus solimangrovi]TPE53063.1 hypothetical protein FJM51_03290 [Amaricoccus solimangrovi]